MRKLVGALVAGLLVAGCGTAGSTPSAPASPEPTPSAAVTPVPSATADFPSWYPSGDSSGAGILPEGTNATRAFRPGFSFSVPEGWVNDGDETGFYSLFPDTPANQAEFGRSGALGQAIHMGPHGSPYFVCESWENNKGATAAEMVAAAAANEVLVVSGLVDVAIGGLTGKQFEVGLNPTWTETCPGDEPGVDLGAGRNRVFLLDAPGIGVIVIIVGSTSSAGFDAFLAEAVPIVESFEFDLQQ